MTPTERAIEKLASGNVAANIAAVLVGECGANDLDGNRWIFRATDGDTIADVEAGLSESQGGHRGQSIAPEVLERTVEWRASGFDVHGCLAALVAHSPLELHAEELR
jgi:hypothetical protein